MKCSPLFWMAAFGAAVLASPAHAGKLKIVTTTTDLAAIARAVAGDHAEVRSITTGRDDPHYLQAKPGFILQARDADLWIRIGLELEIGWEGPVLDGSRNPRIRPGAPGHLDAAGAVQVLDVPKGPVTRAMGDVHPQGNPHYWLDPLNARRIAGVIAERLAVLAPDDADAFRAGAAAFQRALDERMFGRALLDAVPAERLWAMTDDGSIAAFLAEPEQAARAGGWVKQMAPLRDRSILTYHKSWAYFAHRFRLPVAAELEPKPGVPPTAAHLAAVTARARATQAALILQEAFYSTKAAEHVARETALPVVVVANSVGGAPEATDYLALMDLIVQRVSATADRRP